MADEGQLSRLYIQQKACNPDRGLQAFTSLKLEGVISSGEPQLELRSP